jgi:flavin reductase (DIM6/NTAB) family NADH-FMN oxidoreductase RutF
VAGQSPTCKGLAEQCRQSGASSAFDVRAFRRALGYFASGVTVVTARDECKTHGMTANAFVSVSLDPPLVLVSLDSRSYMHRILPVAGRYGVSLLAEDQERLSNHFAGRGIEGTHIPFLTRRGIPLLDGAVGHFVVRVIDAHPAGDHTLYIGEVEYFEAREGRPLLFYAGRYQYLARDIKQSLWPQDEFSLFSLGSVDPPIT